MVCEKGITQTQQRHAKESKEHAHVAIMVEAKAFHKELQANTNHDARSQGEKASIRHSIRRHVCPLGKFEPKGRNARSEGLGQTTQQSRPDHGFQAGVESHVERQGHGKAFRDVVDEQSHEDVESQGRVGMICCVSDEAFGELMQSNGNGCLQSYREECVGGNVVMVLGFHVAFIHLLAGKAILIGLLIRQSQGVARDHTAGTDRCVAGICMGVIVIVIVSSMKGVVRLEMPSSGAESRQRACITSRATA